MLLSDIRADSRDTRDLILRYRIQKFCGIQDKGYRSNVGFKIQDTGVIQYITDFHNRIHEGTRYWMQDTGYRGYTLIQYIEDIQDTVINRKLYEKRDNIISILKCNWRFYKENSFNSLINWNGSVYTAQLMFPMFIGLFKFLSHILSLKSTSYFW